MFTVHLVYVRTLRWALYLNEMEQALTSFREMEIEEGIKKSPPTPPVTQFPNSGSGILNPGWLTSEPAFSGSIILPPT